MCVCVYVCVCVCVYVSITLYFSLYLLLLLLFREEDHVVPEVLAAVLAMPQNTHIAVRYTSICLVGELCEWTEYHPDVLGKSSTLSGRTT